MDHLKKVFRVTSLQSLILMQKGRGTQKGRTILLRSLQKAFWVEFVCFKEWIKFRFHRQCQIIWCHRQTSKGNIVKFWPRKDVYEQDQEAIAEFIKKVNKCLKDWNWWQNWRRNHEPCWKFLKESVMNHWSKIRRGSQTSQFNGFVPTPDTYLNLLVV